MDRLTVSSKRWRELRYSWEKLDASAMQLLSAYFNAQQLLAALADGMSESVVAAAAQGVSLGGAVAQPLQERLFLTASSLASQLAAARSQFCTIVSQMQAVTFNLQEQVAAMTEEERHSALPNGANPAVLSETARELLDLYSAELVLRDIIVDTLSHANTSRRRQLLYISAWLHNPFLSDQAEPLHTVLEFERAPGS